MKHTATSIIPIVSLVVLSAGAASGASSPRLLVTIDGQEPSEHLGGSMSAAGDVNGDGFADLLVGDTRDGWLPGERRCYIYFGGSLLDAGVDLVIPQGEGEDDDHFGQFLAGGYDVNGDGYDDVLITSPWWFSQTGKIYLYHGGSPMDTEPDVGIAAWGSSWMTGFWATGLRGCLLRDLSGDGLDELACLVEAISLDAGAYVYCGGVPTDSVHDLSFQGPGYPGIDLGSDMADGDFDGDGFTDLVLGAYGPDAAWIYLGGAQMDTTPDVRLQASGIDWPHYVCAPGDLNGDGCDDVIVSHGRYAPADIDYPKGFVFFGGSPMDSLADLEFTGMAKYGRAFRMAGGDLDRDGYADLIVGESSFYYPEFARLAVFAGGTGFDTIPDYEITASDSFAEAVAFLGDMTGDGWAEFAVSDPAGPGMIYIYTYGPEAAGGDPTEARPIPTLRIVPNPTRGPVSIWRNGADVTGSPELAAYDVAGHLVRRLLRREGPQIVFWDLRSASGRPVSPGTYVIRLQSGHGTAQQGTREAQSARLVVTR